MNSCAAIDSHHSPPAAMRQVWTRPAPPRQLTFLPCNPRATRTEFVCTVHSSSKCLPGHTTTRVPMMTSCSPTPVVPGFPHPGFLGTEFPCQDSDTDMNASAGRNRLCEPRHSSAHPNANWRRAGQEQEGKDWALGSGGRGGLVSAAVTITGSGGKGSTGRSWGSVATGDRV